MSSMHSLIWFYDIEALTIFQLAQLAGGEGEGQFGAPNMAQDYLQQWLVIIAALFGLTVLVSIYGLLQRRFHMPKAESLGLLLVLVALVLVPLTYSGINDIRAEGLQRRELYHLADGLRQTSDDLTRMVRLYAATGEQAYRDNFEEILDIRNGIAPRPEQYYEIPYWDIALATGERPGELGAPASIQSLMQQAGLRSGEQAMLQESERQSNLLAKLEEDVMDVIAANAGEGGLVFEGETLDALQRIHGQEYHDSKALIMQPLVELVTGSGLDVLIVEGIAHNFLQQRVDILLVLTVVAAVALVLAVDRQNPRESILPSLALLLVLASIFLGRQSLAGNDATGLNAARRQSEIFLADGLRQTSDDLTRMARLYAITGEDSYREYFDEILAIRNGEAPRPDLYFEVPYWDFVLATNHRLGETGEAVAIRTLLERAGVTSASLSLLREAEEQSNILAELENEVMDVVSASAGDDYRLEGEALDGMLRLHGDEYHEAKARIMQPLVDLARQLERDLEQEQEAGRNEFNSIMNLLAGSLLLAALVLVASLYRSRQPAA
ncbi:MAG: hypothetical protein OXH77_03405 [Anaerolineaceae bacterium]|nr:hypothetical protein [Anaerolineaceae bacterium]